MNRERASTIERIKSVGYVTLCVVAFVAGGLGMGVLILFSLILRILIYGAPIWGTVLLIWWLWYA